MTGVICVAVPDYDLGMLVFTSRAELGAVARAAHDQLGRQWKPGQDFRPPPDWDAGFSASPSTS
jgi:hypothetical protein